MKHKHILLIMLLLVGFATSGFAVNYAAQFNTGTPNDYISLGLNTYNTLYSGASGATIEGWFKPASLATSRVFHTGIDGTGITQFAMEIEADGRLTVYARSKTTDSAESATTAPGTIATGNWYHFAMVVSYASGNKYIRLYLNGNSTPAAANNSPVFANTTYAGGTPATGNEDVFGRYSLSSARPYTGLIDEFRFWKYARSVSEIQANMACELPTPYDSRLIGYWKFNTGSGTTAYDSSASAKNGTLLNGTDWTDIKAIDILASSNPALAAATVMAGTAKHPVYNFTISPAFDAATLNQIDFTTGGTYAASDISNLKLWSSTSDDINSATQIGATISSSLGAGAHSFGILAHSMTKCIKQYFWITADISVTATQLNTVNVSAFTTANLTFADGSKVGIAYVGGDQTIDGTLPVELSSFTATINVQNFVNLMWVTQSETGVSGFYIYRGTANDISQAELISPMIVATNTSQQQIYVFTDDQLYNDGVYYYWLQNIDLDGSNSFHGPVVVNYSISGGTEGIPVIPELTELKGIFPNPFNPTAQISYSLKDATTVNIRIYNSRGQIVRSFNNAPGSVGDHRIVWDGRDQSGSSCSTGLYLVRMYAGKDVFTQKAMLVK